MPPIEGPIDAARIFRSLASHDVAFLLIGGLAVQVHGHVRMTNDVDIIPDPNPLNLERLSEALNSLGARVLNPGQERTTITAEMLPRATVWQFTTRHGGIDVIHEVPGGAPFAQLTERAMHVQLEDIAVLVVGLDDLIAMKLARGRRIDMEDVVALTDEG